MTNQEAELAELMHMLEALDERKTFHKLADFRPYPKQREFLMLGATKRERLLMAGNQVGKSECGAAEAAYHMTGQYPPDWKGRRWNKPTRGWIAGETAVKTRDVQQVKLCGQYGVEAAFGSGYIPKDCFVEKPSLQRGVTDAFDTMQVRHVSGGISTAKFLSYEQGRTKFQGEPIDWGWADEEPPMDIYGEFITRITATKGMIYVTFTPLMGMSSVVMRFLSEPSPDRAVVTMTIDDAEHIPAEERAKIIAGYPAHEREARSKGIPMLGSGRIFQFSDESISEPALLNLPLHWTKLWSVDFGIDHPFAAVLSAWDKDNDVFHVVHSFKVRDQMPMQHAFAMKAVAPLVPVAWPQDGHQRDKGSAEALHSIYKKHGLKMLGEHAKWPDGTNSTEAGIVEMQERMATARFKVAAHLQEWFSEYHLYHRKDGLIVKENDDELSATRVGVMAKRFGKPMALKGQLGGGGRGWMGGDPHSKGHMASGLDFDPFTGR